MNGRQTLDCQNCGIVLRILDAREAQAVADRPYNFIFFCGPCAEDERKAMWGAQGGALR